LSEVFQIRWPSLEKRAQGRPGADCARELRVQWVVRRRTRSNRYSRDIPAFPAQWLYGLYVLSPVSGLYCHRCRLRTGSAG
jgi:hypothetical protein